MSYGKVGSRSSSTPISDGVHQRLIYVSPLPYESFSQRPHKFVHWFHGRTGGPVLWLEPYPTRLPNWTDLRRSRSLDRFDRTTTPWLQVASVRALPIEPLPGGTALNKSFWQDSFSLIERFAREGKTILVIGKPSAFANAILDRMPDLVSVYDMMDNFAAFYDGLSSRAIRRNEAQIVAKVETVLCSSTRLLETTCAIRPDAQLVLNALDPGLSLPTSLEVGRPSHAGPPHVFGYVGTIARWFDWDLVRALAVARPDDTVRIIGPLFNPPSLTLPPNVELRPAVPHEEALIQMRQFDVALIPFKENNLTACVDPIKYYEYRATGLAIMTTPFGEMSERCNEDGVFPFTKHELAKISQDALSYRMAPEAQALFTGQNTWNSRFDTVGLLKAP